MEIETPVLLAHAIEDSTDIIRISGGGGFEHPKPPLSVRHCPLMWVQFVCLWHTYNAMFCYAVANNGQLRATGRLWTAFVPE